MTYKIEYDQKDAAARILYCKRNPADKFAYPVSAQDPLAVDGDSVYEKDIDLDNSSIGDFSGSVTDLFNDRMSVVSTSTNNPSLTIALKRPIINHEVSLVTATGNFSNVTLVAKNAAGETLETIDDSANNTKYTSRSYHFVDADTWCVLDISFTTNDDVSLSFIYIPKTTNVDAHLVATKPDGTDEHINATAGGNLKISLEEIESGISVNANSQLRTTLYDPTGSTLYFNPRVQTPTGSVIQVQIGPGDIISNLPIFVPYEHHQLHEGETHYAQYVDTALETNTVEFAIVVPTFAPANAATCPHMLLRADVYNGSARINMYEGATYDAGTPLTAYNRERNSATTSSTSVIAVVTSSNGTLLQSFFVGSGRSTAGEGRSGSEWILKSNTIYRVSLIGLAAGTDCILEFNWYEDLGV